MGTVVGTDNYSQADVIAATVLGDNIISPRDSPRDVSSCYNTSIGGINQNFLRAAGGVGGSPGGSVATLVGTHSNYNLVAACEPTATSVKNSNDFPPDDGKESTTSVSQKGGRGRYAQSGGAVFPSSDIDSCGAAVSSAVVGIVERAGELSTALDSESVSESVAELSRECEVKNYYVGSSTSISNSYNYPTSTGEERLEGGAKKNYFRDSPPEKKNAPNDAAEAGRKGLVAEILAVRRSVGEVRWRRFRRRMAAARRRKIFEAEALASRGVKFHSSSSREEAFSSRRSDAESPGKLIRCTTHGDVQKNCSENIVSPQLDVSQLFSDASRGIAFAGDHKKLQRHERPERPQGGTRSHDRKAHLPAEEHHLPTSAEEHHLHRPLTSSGAILAEARGIRERAARVFGEDRGESRTTTASRLRSRRFVLSGDGGGGGGGGARQLLYHASSSTEETKSSAARLNSASALLDHRQRGGQLTGAHQQSVVAPSIVWSSRDDEVAALPGATIINSTATSSSSNSIPWGSPPPKQTEVLQVVYPNNSKWSAQEGSPNYYRGRPGGGSARNAGFLTNPSTSSAGLVERERSSDPPRERGLVERAASSAGKNSYSRQRSLERRVACVSQGGLLGRTFRSPARSDSAALLRNICAERAESPSVLLARGAAQYTSPSRSLEVKKIILFFWFYAISTI